MEGAGGRRVFAIMVGVGGARFFGAAAQYQGERQFRDVRCSRSKPRSGARRRREVDE